MSTILYSNTYYHNLKELKKQLSAGSITKEEYEKQRDTLTQEELKNNPLLGSSLALNALKQIEGQAEVEADNEIAEQQRLLLEEQQLKNHEQFVVAKMEQEKKRATLFEMQHYRGKVDLSLANLIRKIQARKQWYTWAQVIIIVFSALTSSLVYSPIDRGFVFFAGVTVTIAEGLTIYFKLQENIYTGAKAKASIEIECQKYDYRIAEYEKLDPKDAYLRFKSVITEIQSQQLMQEVEFLNPIHHKEKKIDPVTEAKKKTKPTPVP